LRFWFLIISRYHGHHKQINSLVEFAQLSGHNQYCNTCPLKDLCTCSKRGRVMTFVPNHSYARAQRANFANEEIQASYKATRPSVERIHAQMKRKLNGSKLRYRGVDKNTMHYLLLGTLRYSFETTSHYKSGVGYWQTDSFSLSSPSYQSGEREEEPETKNRRTTRGTHALPGTSRGWGLFSTLLAHLVRNRIQPTQ